VGYIRKGFLVISDGNFISEGDMEKEVSNSLNHLEDLTSAMENPFA
jgi:hypothetical protein